MEICCCSPDLQTDSHEAESCESSKPRRPIGIHFDGFSALTRSVTILGPASPTDGAAPSCVSAPIVSPSRLMFPSGPSVAVLHSSSAHSRSSRQQIASSQVLSKSRSASPPSRRLSSRLFLDIFRFADRQRKGCCDNNQLAPRNAGRGSRRNFSFGTEGWNSGSSVSAPHLVYDYETREPCAWIRCRREVLTPDRHPRKDDAKRCG